jgi:hypothetical protein
MADGDTEHQSRHHDDLRRKASQSLLEYSAATLAAEGTLSLDYQVNVMSRDVVPR